MSFWHLAYNLNWASKKDLGLAVQLKEITADEFEEITGEEYKA